MDSTARKPVFESLEHVSAGWINKYVLTYRMPDGRTHVYESASRKKRDDYERELRAMDKLAISARARPKMLPIKKALPSIPRKKHRRLSPPLPTSCAPTPSAS